VKYTIDTTILIDHLRGFRPAEDLLTRLVGEDAEFISSVIVRLEVLAGMTRGEETETDALLKLVEWQPIAETECDAAGALGRQYLPANSGIDSADLLIAEVARRHGAELLTTNVKHFRDMFPGLTAPYSDPA
jgi:predicted nucleic acid-binding protein